MYVALSARVRALIGVCARATDPRLSIVVFPSLPHLALAADEINKKSAPVAVGVQNISQYSSGAYTGDVSAAQARNSGASYVLIGHSERRNIFGETDAMIREKLSRAWQARLVPVLCVGESVRATPVRAFAAARAQLDAALSGNIGRRPLFVAYEPVWAIGGDKKIDSGYAASVMRLIRQHLAKKNISVRGILYGGSVGDKTVGAFLSSGACDGVLVGSASADPKKLSRLFGAIGRAPRTG